MPSATLLTALEAKSADSSWKRLLFFGGAKIVWLRLNFENVARCECKMQAEAIMGLPFTSAECRHFRPRATPGAQGAPWDKLGQATGPALEPVQGRHEKHFLVA
jgi:hypothetical protein